MLIPMHLSVLSECLIFLTYFAQREVDGHFGQKINVGWVKGTQILNIGLTFRGKSHDCKTFQNSTIKHFSMPCLNSIIK